MPRIRGSPPGRRQVYWWTDELAQMRSDCSAARRRYTRQRRMRNSDKAAKNQLYQAYREIKKALQKNIKKTKNRAWKELRKTRQRSLGAPVPDRPQQNADTDTSRHGERSPTNPGRDHRHLISRGGRRWSSSQRLRPLPGVPAVSPGELGSAVKRMTEKKKAPGPDGVSSGAWAVAIGTLGDRLRRLFTTCLEQEFSIHVADEQARATQEAGASRRVTIGIPPHLPPQRGEQIIRAGCSDSPHGASRKR